MDIEQFKTATVGNVIGYGYHAGFGTGGECGELASYWFSELTNDQYQFAYGKPGINASWAIGSDCATAWNVAYQSDWNAMGFEKIDNPSASQLKKGDIFFISARSGLSTGHVGIVYSTENNNIATIEQNYGGARYTQYMPGDNSWSYYGGFSCVVRPIESKEEAPKPQPNKPEIKKEEINMFLVKTVDKMCPNHKVVHKSAAFICNGECYRHIPNIRELELFEKTGIPWAAKTMWEHEIEHAIKR
jgi:hypothetical protein